MPSGLPNDIRESIAIANAKSVAEQPAMLSNLAFANLVTNTNLAQQNALANQQAMYQMSVTVTAKAVNKISDLSPVEALAITKLDTSNDVAQQIADLKVAGK
ncbi:RebB family R body protein [Anabaena azotica]|uniref:RebB family R body protein n=1 Tax=Anabaena azotica FACHB-119 TaxID=947527 RepID=A0ABR8D4P6_9NOST|nr:RebB family R body protein [Anabaena azotica]MBD2502134.1 RebB family R body protein [Anabaena azotica FACHB-119]